MANTHCLDLEASSSQYAYSSASTFDFSGNFTVSCWVKLETLPTGSTVYTIASKYVGSSGLHSFWFYFYESTGLTFLVSGDGSTDKSVAYALSNFVVGRWYHVAGVFAANSEINIYVNGKPVANNSTAIPSVIDVNTGVDFIIGASDSPASNFFDGLIDNFVIYSSAFNDSQILGIYKNEAVGTEGSLVACYNFNNNYTDSSPNNNTLIASGSPVFSTDYFDAPRNLDLEKDSAQYATTTVFTGMPTSNTMTVEAWCKFESIENDHKHTIISREDATGETNKSFWFYYGKEGVTPYFGFTIGNYDYRVNYTGISTNIWYHLAATFNNGDYKLYVNGTQVGSSTGTAQNIPAVGANLTLGSKGTALSRFDGLIKDVRIWNDVRTAQEIADNMGKEVSSTEAGLVAYYKLNNNYLDSTSNNNNLTPVNSPTFVENVLFGNKINNIVPVTNYLTTSLDYFVGNEDKQVLVVVVTHASSNSISISYDGSALTNAASVYNGDNSRTSYIYYIATPSTGWNTLSFTGTLAQNTFHATIFVLKGINTGEPIGYTYTDYIQDSPSTTVTVEGTSGVVVDFIGGSVYDTGYWTRNGGTALSTYTYDTSIYSQSGYEIHYGSNITRTFTGTKVNSASMIAVEFMDFINTKTLATSLSLSANPYNSIARAFALSIALSASVAAARFLWKLLSVTTSITGNLFKKEISALRIAQINLFGYKLRNEIIVLTSNMTLSAWVKGYLGRVLEYGASFVLSSSFAYLQNVNRIKAKILDFVESIKPKFFK